MKVTFLGTSHGVPGADRYCTSLLLEAGGYYYILDGGAPVGDLLCRMGIGMEKIRAVFNTHAHGDHFLGLLSLIDLVNWYFGDTEMTVFVPRESQVQFIKDMSLVTENRPLSERITVKKFEAGTVYEDELISVTAERTDHLRGGDDFFSYAFTVTEKATGKRFLFAGDCDAPLDDIDRITAGNSYELCVFECAHFPAELLIAHLAPLHTKRAAVIHVYPLDKYDSLDAVRGDFGFELLTPADGDSVEL